MARLLCSYCRFPLAEFAIRDSQIIKSLGKIGVQPSGFKIFLYGLSEPALRCESDSRFVVFGGRVTRRVSFAHDGADSIVFSATVEIGNCRKQAFTLTDSNLCLGLRIWASRSGHIAVRSCCDTTISQRTICRILDMGTVGLGSRR